MVVRFATKGCFVHGSSSYQDTALAISLEYKNRTGFSPRRLKAVIWQVHAAGLKALP
jgi:hypothetical protein